MSVDINTKMVTLLGKPLNQSYAARMQNSAYKAAGLNMLYFYSEVENDHLEDIVNGIRYMNFAGFAVTKPNKVEIMKYVDEVDPLCQKMNASNTVVLKDGKLKAYNTDGIGFFRSLMEEVPDLDVKETVFFCMGAGGAGRAICSVLAYNGAKKIYITNRSLSKAEELANDINENFANIAQAVDIEDMELYKATIGESDVIMNNTGLGMLSSLDMTPVPKEFLNKNQICFDATYNPEKTKFLEDAESIGCKIINGLGMSLYQGAQQIELWSGKEAPIEAMRSELLTILSEKE
ncbi:shikimate dehydrogenase [Acetoanaerobium pronyense]|uniref:Shikimate dehydrogenase (NADP(+)) n=1 Tax=Acetoanaerobium pronyense TaxID=1482736 RepID=A0ABS4KFF7_9FIRM|nr:shikimate dehydrogenase [Acetoanaerobium pronyense]MBP2026502.1 shikimate dehydrogenase [Acetoanaerobium pronyense]